MNSNQSHREELEMNKTVNIRLPLYVATYLAGNGNYNNVYITDFISDHIDGDYNLEGYQYDHYHILYALKVSPRLHAMLVRKSLKTNRSIARLTYEMFNAAFSEKV